MSQVSCGGSQVSAPTLCPKWTDHVFDLYGEEQYQCGKCHMVINGAWFESLPPTERKVKGAV